MKKVIIVIFCAAFAMSFTQDKKKTVKADGPVVKKERNTDSFNGVHTSTAIDVYLRQGSGCSLSIEAEENLHEHIRAEVKDNILHLYTKVNVKNSKGMKAYVGIADITSLKATSAGDIYGESVIKANEIELGASSAGDIKIELEAGKVKAESSSAGDIKLSGKADYLEARASSSGDLMAGDFEVREAKVSVSSSGDILINVKDKLEAHASSTGDVRYMGNPEVEAKTSSAGSVRKK